jgi:hypothetical protein
MHACTFVPELNKANLGTLLSSYLRLTQNTVTIFTSNIPHDKREFVPPEPKEY